MAPTMSHRSSSSSSDAIQPSFRRAATRGRSPSNGFRNYGAHAGVPAAASNTCYWCKKTFGSQAELGFHKPRCTVPRPCSECKASFPNRAELIKHFHTSPQCNKSSPKYQYKDEQRKAAANAGAPTIHINGDAVSSPISAAGKGKGKELPAEQRHESQAFDLKGVAEAIEEVDTSATQMVRSSSEATSASAISAKSAPTEAQLAKAARKKAKRKQKRLDAAAASKQESADVSSSGRQEQQRAMLSPEIKLEDRSPSPAESIASSTDEILFASPRRAATAQAPIPTNGTSTAGAPATPQKPHAALPEAAQTSNPPSVPAPTPSASASPFARPLTAFDVLDASFAAAGLRAPSLQPAIPAVPPPAAPSSTSVVTPTGVAQKNGLSAPVAASSSAIVQEQARAVPIPPQTPPVAASIAGQPKQPATASHVNGETPAGQVRPKIYRKVIASPMSWGTGHVAPPPTLGSNASNSAQPTEEETVDVNNAITKAAYGTSRDTILSQLATKKQERKEAARPVANGSEASASGVTGERAASANEAPAEEAVKEDQSGWETLEEKVEETPQPSRLEEEPQVPERPAKFEDSQIIARDMVSSSSPGSQLRPLPPPTSGWESVGPFSAPALALPRAAPSQPVTVVASQDPQLLAVGSRPTVSAPTNGSRPEQIQQAHTVASADQLVDTLQETSAVQGTLPAEATGAVAQTASTATEEDDEGTASDASGASRLVRHVIRDISNRQGWETSSDAGGDASPDVSKAQQRLQTAIYELNRRHMPSQEVIRQRQEIANAVRRKLNAFLPEWAPDFQYTIEPFGSTAYGLDTDNSDLDLCIMDPKRPEGFRNASDLYDVSSDTAQNGTQAKETNGSTDEGEAAPSERALRRREKKAAEAVKKTPWVNDKKTALGLEAIYDVHRLAGVLRRMGFVNVTPIPSAGVPIVKFVSTNGIKADMNANEQLGVRNSALIASYVRIHPIVRPFLIFLKIWAKQRNLNDPSGAHGSMSLSSYSLVIMAIGYMQHIGLVPNLQDPALIKQAGLERQAFWTKIPNRNAIKPGRRKGRFLGDYKAMVVETTFVKALPKDASFIPSIAVEDVPKAEKPRRRSSTSERRGGAGTGWTSDADHDFSADADKPLHLIKLVEGFFRYYTSHFSLFGEAVSIWAGKPLSRSMGYIPLATDEQGDLFPQLPKITLEEREELYEEEGVEEEEEIINKLKEEEVPQKNGSHLEAAVEEEEDEELKAAEAEEQESLARIIEQMRELGASPTEIKPLEDDLQAKRTVSSSIRRQETAAAPAVSDDATAAAASAAAYTGLDLPVSGVKDYRFPFPAEESPATFIEPPTWTQKLIVQDPFIHTRNTCLNIQPRVVDRIMAEMSRAADLISSGAKLEKVLLNVKKDPDFAITDEAKGRIAMKRERAEHKKQRNKDGKKTMKFKEYKQKRQEQKQERAARRAQRAERSDRSAAAPAEAQKSQDRD